MSGSTTRGITYPDSSDTYPATPWWQKLAQTVDDAISAAVKGLASQDDLAGKAPLSHTHAESDVTGLTDDLAGKAPLKHTHVMADVTDLSGATIDLVSGQSAQPSAASSWDTTGLRVRRLGKHHAILEGFTNPTATSSTGTVSMFTLPSWAAPSRQSVFPVTTGSTSLPAARVAVGTDGAATIQLPTTLNSGTPVYFTQPYPLD